MIVRIIPRLDIKGPNLVKGIHFEGLRVLGTPAEFARRYYDQGADELLYMDAVASLYGRNSLLDVVERTSREVFIPLTVGGGLRSIDDIRTVLRAGADRVAINTAAVDRPAFVREAAQAFGSSTIVVSIEAIRTAAGGYACQTDYGRQDTGVDAVRWAKQAVELGAGELAVTSIDREGTGRGFDLELTRRIATEVPVPVIACGGAGTMDHVYEAVVSGRAQAVGLASLLHYHEVRRFQGAVPDTPEGNVEFLSGRSGARARSRIEDAALSAVKHELAARGVACRHPSDAGGT